MTNAIGAVESKSRIGLRRSPFPECSRDTAFKKAIGRQADRARNGEQQLFSAAGERLYPPGATSDLRLCSAKQNSRCPPSSAVLRPLSQKTRRCRPGPHAVF
jgi:hypothetical protein